MSQSSTEPQAGSESQPYQAFLQSLTDANRKLLENFVGGMRPAGDSQPKAFEQFMQGLMGNTQQLVGLQSSYYQQQMDLWMGLLGTREKQPNQPASKGDRRFAAPEWAQYPFYDYIKQQYLLSAKWLNELVDGVPMDDPTRVKVGFYTQQFIDAMSPSNFALTNPEVIKLALDT
ncbi:MAG: hypothetical protein JNM11_03025, partial [Chitinimonas sp.]|nr:hypothetical protein [Chitinimonas sp.]